MPLLLFFSPIQIPFHWSPLEAKQCQGLFPFGSDVEVIQVIFFWDRSGLSVRWTSLILYLTAGQWPMVSPRPFDQKPVSSYHHLLRKCPPLPLSLRIGVEDNTAESPPGWRRRSTASIAIQNPSHQPTGVYQHPAMSTSQTPHLNNFLFNTHFLVALCILDHVFEDTFYALGRTLIGWSCLKCPHPSPVTIMVTRRVESSSSSPPPPKPPFLLLDISSDGPTTFLKRMRLVSLFDLVWPILLHLTRLSQPWMVESH